jgi:chromosome partitioning protein
MKHALKVATNVIRDLQAYPDAAQQGTVVGRFGRKGVRAAADIEALFTELLGESITQKTKEGRQRVANG